jgi:hypothetical protein
MKILGITLLALVSISIYASEIRLINTNDGTIIYVTKDRLNEYVRDNGEYEVDMPISLPTHSVERINLKNNQSLEQQQRKNFSVISPSLDYIVGEKPITLPTDPSFYLQYFWEKPTTSYYAQSDISSTHGTIIPLAKPRVGIVDSGFWENSDLAFSEGYNFVDISSKGLSPNASWQMLGNTLAEREACGFAHGTGVASVIGAITDNSSGIAGIADVDLIAGKAMECGTGYFSNAIDAMNWMSGEIVGSAPDISEPVQVINMSLGGVGECKAYMQAGIDNILSKGILITVSSGNDGIDASNHYPSNCKGVITTSALTRTGELSSFSNFGTTNDVGALGVSVYALGPADGAVYGWDGTSFSSPITAGILARTIARYPNIPTTTIKSLLFQSSGEFNPSLNCSIKGCGIGVSNATNLDNMAKSYNSGDIFTFKSALAEMPFCDKTKYFTFSGDKARLCALTMIVFTDDVHYSANDSYELYKVAKGDDLTVTNGTLVLSTNDKTSIAGSSDIDLAVYNYGFRVCTADTCKLEELIPANLSHYNSPTACN